MPGGVYTGGNATVIMDPPPVVYRNVFHSGSGPDRHLKRKTEKVASTARVNAPRRSGRLAANIFVDQNRGEKGRYSFGYRVYTPVFYGYYVHEGTGPSVRQSYPNVMKFDGTNAWAGSTIYTDIVYHPGTPAQPFLEQALVAMVD